MNPCTSLFIERLPKKPYCTNELGSLYIRNRVSALRHSYLQHNSPDAVSTLVFDIDRPGAAYAWEDAGLPAPHWIAVNPKNNHCHLGYQLASPVCRTDAARARPLRYLAAIERVLARRLGADMGYAGLITKNPLHRDWTVIWNHHAPFTLGYLAEFCPDGELFGYQRTPAPVGLGRNVCLFDTARQWAYSAIRGYWQPNGADRWADAVRAHLEGLNFGLDASTGGPLPDSEIKSMCRSIARWTWRHITPSGFSAVQAARGAKGGRIGGRVSRGGGRPSKSGKARSELLLEVLRLKGQGYSNRDIAEDLGISASTVSLYLKKSHE